MKKFNVGKPFHLFAISLVACNILTITPSHAIVSSNTGPNAFSGIDINTFIGADTFYNAGYTGSNAVALSVDAGHIWNQHETLGKVSNFLDARSIYTNNGLNFEQLGEFDDHGTSVAQALAGEGLSDYQRGLAYGAELWSGAVATSYVPNSGSFSISRAFALLSPYEQGLITGVNGRTADVVNSSIGVSSANANYFFAVALDAMLVTSGATSVVSAGNSGAVNNAVNDAPGGYNSIVVGALGSDTSNYDSISSFSSRGPLDYVSPTGVTIADVRARVDIVAPGQNLTLAYYGGTTGSNINGTDVTNGQGDWYQFNSAGTSYSGPIVAGAATLLNDVAYDRFSGNAHARNGQVIKAVLLNSATKIAGWDNGQQVQNNIVTTTQALDYNSGAGALNLTEAFNQFTSGTTDLAGFDGGNIETIGWDYAVVNESSFEDYYFNDALAAGASFTATLNWFAGRSYSTLDAAGNFSVSDDYFTDLALELHYVENGQSMLVAQSNAEYINTEHLSFMLQTSGQYFLRVNWIGELYDFVNNSEQTYGLAWATVAAVPEPSTWMMLALGGIFILRRTQYLVRLFNLLKVYH